MKLHDMRLLRNASYIAGAWQETGAGSLTVANPATGESIAEVVTAGRAQTEVAIAAAHDAMKSWREVPAKARAQVLRRWFDLMMAHQEDLAIIMTTEQGKALAESRGEVAYGAAFMEWFGEQAKRIDGDVIPAPSSDKRVVCIKQPVGVVAAITPWNSPLLLLTWKLAPALAAGCTVVIKPSEFTSTSTLRLVELFEEAGFPPGVVNVVTGFGAEVGARLVDHPKVAKVAFTGGSDSGARVYQAAAAGLKRCTLELGGKSPNSVFDDADLDDAVKGAISGIFAATGQTCIAGSRLLVQDSIYDAFVAKLVEFARTARMGDPMDRNTQVGPVTTPPQYEKILSYIEVAKDEGAEVLLGGSPAQGRPETGESKYFIEPTIFGGVTNSMRIAQEEVFGPVLSIIRFKTDEEAVEIANDIAFGLAAGVWTQSIKRAIKISKAVRAGTVWVNTYRAVSYMSPFGGYKQSGLGRENGIESIREYLQTKSVWISTADDVPNPFVMR